MKKWHYSKVGTIAEINGVEEGELTNDYFSQTALYIIIFLLLDMPLYSLWVLKVKPFFNWFKEYSISVYQDLFLKGIFVAQMIMLQGAAVLILALLGKYTGFWDWYWILLIFANYLALCLFSLFRQKRLVLCKDKFYYCSFRQRMEGSLEEIERVQRMDKGVVFQVRGEELKIWCTKEKYVDTLLKRLSGRGK